MNEKEEMKEREAQSLPSPPFPVPPNLPPPPTPPLLPPNGFFSFLGRALLGRARVAIGVLFVVLFCLGMGSVGGYMITYIHVQHASRRWREPRGRGSGIGGQTPQIFF